MHRQLVQLGWEVYKDDPTSDIGGEPSRWTRTPWPPCMHRRRQLEDRMTWGSARADSGKMFTREDCSALHPATATDRFQATSTAAGLRRVALPTGIPMKVVQETLGHSSIGLTADTYTSVYPQVAAEPAEATAIVPHER